MGQAASVVKMLSCDSCAKYVFNGASMKSQCCDEDDACNFEVRTEATKIETSNEEVEIEMDSGCEGLCCNCIMRAHK